jgi:hypothetical protein
MIDVEFISELAVAVLNGLQNKKKRLEEFYQQHETKFEDQEKLRSIFVRVLGEIEQLIPNLAKTRWRKKSDDYTLFVLVAKHVAQLPLPSDKRDLASVAVREFADMVDRVIKEEIAKDEIASQGVLDYVTYVERAASDLAPRRERERVFMKVGTSADRS